MLGKYMLIAAMATVMMLGCSDSRNHDSKTEENSSISSSENNASTSDQTSSEQSAGDVNGSSSDDNITSTIDPALQSLELYVAAEELPENSETNVSVRATYIGGKVTAPRTEIIWHISDANIVEINNSRLLAKAEGTATVRAEAGGKLSPEKSITVYKIIHGHRLPPKPDPAINNSTLLGIDINDNGVRDDVERWIYETYDHPIERGLFMQLARAYQTVIIDPEKAHKTGKFMDNTVSCELYWKYKEVNHPISRYRDLEKEISPMQLNTVKRHMAYKRYNAEFSGDVFGAPPVSKEKCEFDDNGFLKN